MDIKISHSTLTKYLRTNATPNDLAKALTACGPSVDRLHQIDQDWQYDIEVITNRIDSISAIGLAKEASAILPQFGFTAEAVYPETEVDLPQSQENMPLEIHCADTTLAPQITALVVDDVNVSPSPSWLSHELELMGERALNNLVDITNYVTHTHGHPIHFFDYDQIVGHKMLIRESLKGESITTLDGKTHKLAGGDIVIEDESGSLIDLCGIMGGQSSQISEKTKRIIIFILTYDPKRIRKSSLRYQVRTLASQIFEKKPDPNIVPTVLNACLFHLKKFSPNSKLSTHIHINHLHLAPKTVTLSLKWLNKFLGVKTNAKQVIEILDKLGIQHLKTKSDSLTFNIPSWRYHDLNIKEDLAEEFSRVYGYYQIPSILPTSTISPINPAQHLSWERVVKFYLANIGFNEIYNYSLVNPATFTSVGMDIEPSLNLLNPLSSDYTHLRRSLIPNLIHNFIFNFPRQTVQQIFELSNIYLPDSHTELPQESPILCMIQSGTDYRTSKGVLESLFQFLKISNLQQVPLDDTDTVFKSSHAISIYHGEVLVGIFGQIKETLLRPHLDTISPVYLTNLDFGYLSQLANRNHVFQSVPSTNHLIEVITLKSNLLIFELLENLRRFSPLITKVEYLESFEKSHTFRLTFNDPNQDLNKEDLSNIKKSIVAKLSVLE